MSGRVAQARSKEKSKRECGEARDGGEESAVKDLLEQKQFIDV